MSFRKTLTALAVAASLATGSASAATILTMGQTNQGSPLIGSNNNAGTTTLTANAVPVTITQILEGVVTPVNAFLQLNATSLGAAQTLLGQVLQEFTGSFTITNGGTNYLSGTFGSALFAPVAAGTSGGGSLTLNGSEPDNAVSFTSNVISLANLQSPFSMAFSFANVSPVVSIVNGSIGSFTSSVSGTFSAESVPEPASLLLLGAGLFGVAVLRRRHA